VFVGVVVSDDVDWFFGMMFLLDDVGSMSIDLVGCFVECFRWF